MGSGGGGGEYCTCGGGEWYGWLTGDLLEGSGAGGDGKRIDGGGEETDCGGGLLGMPIGDLSVGSGGGGGVCGGIGTDFGGEVSTGGDLGICLGGFGVGFGDSVGVGVACFGGCGVGCGIGPGNGLFGSLTDGEDGPLHLDLLQSIGLLTIGRHSFVVFCFGLSGKQLLMSSNTMPLFLVGLHFWASPLK